MRIPALALVVLFLASPAFAADCTKTSTTMTPLTDLGKRMYGGFHGGLYPGARNTPTAKYRKQGLAAARAVHPVNGKIVLLSIGMSNATQEYSAFQRLASQSGRVAADVSIVDGAQGGQDARVVADPNSSYWTVVEQRLAQAGATDAQVQAVWLKEAIANPSGAFPDDATQLETYLVQIIGDLEGRFPNLKLIYLSSRTYAGYATSALNPEPYAYDSGFAVRWTIARRIDGRPRGAWLGWGPYLWTNGTAGRSDGLTWQCEDVVPGDGTHPSASGQLKVAQLLLRFFTTDPTARGWFTTG